MIFRGFFLPTPPLCGMYPAYNISSYNTSIIHLSLQYDGDAVEQFSTTFCVRGRTIIIAKTTEVTEEKNAHTTSIYLHR